MTTEVQIRKSRVYLPHLCKIVACIASKLGMSREGIQEAQDAVSEVCSASIDMADGQPESSLSIKLAADDSCMTVEITDACLDLGTVSSDGRVDGHRSADRFARVLTLADGVELIKGGEGTTVRITKHARKLVEVTPASLHYSLSPGTTSWHT